MQAQSPLRFGEALARVAPVVPEEFDRFRSRLDADWIEEALHSTEAATLRRRRLPAQQVVWLVVGMGLMRNRPILDLVDKLNLALPGSSGVGVAPSAVTQARGRLGSDPMQWLFLRSGAQWGTASADAHRWRGLALFGVDGTTMRVADSVENRDHFGGQAGRQQSDSGYPLVRLAALMALRSHVLVSASFGPYDSEHRYAADLWQEIPDESLTIVDRGFSAAAILIPLARDGQNRHWLTRATSNRKWRVVERLGRGDELIEVEVKSDARRADPSLPRFWRMRAIRYQRKGFRPQTLLTSLVDAEAFPRDDLVGLYHERWELELGYDEVKTEMLDREETLRSRTPEMVYQEIWGVLLAYNLVRLEMEAIADDAGVEPTRISFVAALRYICDEWFWLEGTRTPGAIPRQLANMRTNIKRFILPPRRARTYPRAVKIKMSNYERKRPVTDGAVN